MTDTSTAYPADTAPPSKIQPFADQDDDRTKAMEASMTARGESTVELVEVDYFAVTEEHLLVLPDGKQWISHKELNEGDRRKYLKNTNRDVKLQRATGDAFLRMQPGEDRVALIKAAVTGWELKKGGKPFLFTPKAVDDILEAFPPKIIDLINQDIFKWNPWLLQEMTVEDIDREIATLQEQREAKVLELAGKENS